MLGEKARWLILGDKIDKRREELAVQESQLMVEIQSAAVRLDSLKAQQISVRGAMAILEEVETWLEEGADGDVHDSGDR